MPIPAAIIAAGITAAGGAAQSAFTGRMNKKSRQFQEKMWNMTNEYNTPLNQRARLEAAGLNPNLMYGNSASPGNANMPAKPDFNTPPIGEFAASTASSYFNTKAVMAGIDVNEARADEIKQDTINKGIDAVNKAINAASGEISLRQKRELYETTIKTARERLENLSVNTDYTRAKNAREERIIDETETKLNSEIENLEKQGKILDEEAIMKRIDRILYQDYKVRPQDPIYMRIIAELFKNMGFNPFKD